jgi:hypothetical protein
LFIKHSKGTLHTNRNTMNSEIPPKQRKRLSSLFEKDGVAKAFFLAAAFMSFLRRRNICWHLGAIDLFSRSTHLSRTPQWMTSPY